MAARLAPGESAPIMTFLEAVAPGRNLAHMHSLRAMVQGNAPLQQDLNALADVATPDSLIAYRFGVTVNAYLSGDNGRAAGAAKLTDWRDNEVRFAQVAKRHSALEQALPISADVGELARIGLNALNALQRGRILSVVDLAHATTVLDRQVHAEQASADVGKGLLRQQPPADLLIIIAPTIRILVDAAGKSR